MTNELHGKVIFRDSISAVPKTAPMVIFANPTSLFFSPEDRADLAASDFPHREEWLSGLPSGLHFRRLGNMRLAVLWEHVHASSPVSDPPSPDPEFDPLYPELVIRGLASVIPRFRDYFRGNESLQTQMDGGYYTKTPKNLPLIDELPSPRGAFVCGALSGFGIMSSCAAGELAALRIFGKDLPAYSAAFELRSHLAEENRAPGSSIPGSQPREVQL